MGSITDGGGGFQGVATRAIRAAQGAPGHSYQPTIADLVGGVARHLNGDPLAPPGTTVTPLSAYQPSSPPNAPGPYAPPPGNRAPGSFDFTHPGSEFAPRGVQPIAAGSPLANLPPTVGGLQTGIQTALTRPTGNPTDVASIIRLIRQIQGIG